VLLKEKIMAESKKAESSKVEKFTCPECEAKGIHKVFEDARGRGTHRRAAHGVAGASASTLAYHKKHDKKEPPKTRSKKSVSVAIAPVKVQEEKIAAVTEKQAQIGRPSVAIMGYAMGRLESLAVQIAQENELPAKEFVRLVATNLAEWSKR
jgi:hypothetical protein